MANTYHQLGTLAQDRGDYNTAHDRYQQSLTIFEELGNRANMEGYSAGVWSHFRETIL